MSTRETNCERPGKVCGHARWGEQDDLCLCRLGLVLPVGELEEGSCQCRALWRLSVCLSACCCWLTRPADQGMSGSVLAIPGEKRH